MSQSLYDFNSPLLTGQDKALKDYQGKVLLIVNTASKCGLTPQYEGLEAMYQDLKDRGFEILGFPCNQFGAQEPGSSDEIAEFCSVNYGVSFPMFAKVDVNGDEASPIFQYLKAATGVDEIKWNFNKFLVNQTGDQIENFEPMTDPADIKPAIEKLLDA